MTLKTFLTLYYIITWAKANSIDYGDCGSVFEIKEVNLQGCSMIPCIVEIGGIYNIEMVIKTTSTSNTLTQESLLNLKEHDLIIPIEVTPVDLCTVLSCPVQAGENTLLQSTIFIPYEMFVTRAELRWMVYTNGETQAVCMKTSLILVWPGLRNTLVPPEIHLNNSKEEN